VLRQGPFSAFLHGVIEYAGALVFIVAPFVFGFESDAATALAIVLGVGVLAFTASSDLPTGLAKIIPVVIHVLADFALAVLLVAAPFLFDFTDEPGPTAFFIVLGLGHLLVSIGTRYLAPGAPRRGAGTGVGVG
jgi:hypothetical protein